MTKEEKMGILVFLLFILVPLILAFVPTGDDPRVAAIFAIAAILFFAIFVWLIFAFYVLGWR